MKSIYPYFLFIVLFTNCVNIVNAQNSEKVKYIFYFIGDGFGLSQSILAEDYLVAKNIESGNVCLNMLKMPVQGMAVTRSANSLVTCSSAAGTALACGTKTNNGMLGISPNNEKLNSIAKALHNSNYKIGIISTVSLDHATPAAFYANAENRRNYTDIAKQIAISEFEYFGGGSLLAEYEDKSIWNVLKDSGYFVSNNKTDICDHLLKEKKIFATSSTIADKADIPYYIDNPKHDMHLSFFVKNAIDFFGNGKENFFIMAESGKIDWACHSNDPAAVLFEILELDKAYKVAFDFYLKHPDETLIVFTSDHETGGFSIGQKSTGYNCYPILLDKQKYSEVILRNKIDSVITENLNIETVYNTAKTFFSFNMDETLLNLNHLDSVRIEGLFNIYNLKNKSADDYQKYGLRNNETFCKLFLLIFSEKVGVGWTTGDHSGVAVPVRAIGVKSEKFNGFYDNTDIPKKIFNIAGLKNSLN